MEGVVKMACSSGEMLAVVIGVCLAVGMVMGGLLHVIIWGKHAGESSVVAGATGGSGRKKKKTGKPDYRGECKMVLCVRTDLKMNKGKMCAQCGHATLGAYTRSRHNNSPYLDSWHHYGQTKIALKVTSEEQLLALEAEAKRRGVPHYLVADAGRTQIAAGSITVLGLGPAPIADLDEITGHLKLL
mmetsp:Transcript_34447/g.97141  ORF Transcript_34447/g.97141 Transcript_34447/m.97141 type:complete len:186 (+) Transcript_34447:161-718(+)|eukprot:CAMPEP_0119119294 /NCGR_PEP_ID=MMETSP1310-20130426/846_1 /TAXON_ID=464262 /ORGANISM="Genus nov. species nov., Strain RCC2339" /LENGTH=185 /DNA_ID=CAMNT_0007108719 /DNA_START=90 /DNA_END=647 /DNA_ORIENTATION=+